jgi:transcriptional regulator with XRE-family HTH domain
MTKTPYDLFVEQLRSVRKARKLSQSAVARKIRLSRAQYTAIENGRSSVSFVHIYNLSVALGVRFSIGENAMPFASRYVSE